MNKNVLEKHIVEYLNSIKNNDSNAIDERNERKIYYQSYNKEKIIAMNYDEFYEYIGKLWAMLIWGNKKYKIDQLIEDNGFIKLKSAISELIYGKNPMDIRWDEFNKNIKGFGPAMMSELLCYIYPEECMLWNRTAVSAYQLLEIPNVPLRNYQMNGKKYVEMTKIANDICNNFKEKGYYEADLLFVDYFFWDQLRKTTSKENQAKDKEEFIKNKSYHNEIIDYIKNIGTLLGYNTNLKGNIKDSGKIADAIWEFNVGNIGKIKYVFEVQDSGSIDSLIVSLMNASQDISVQAVVAVSDKTQISKIKKHCNNINGNFNRKLKFWDIEEVERAYIELSNSMEIINRSINVDFEEKI